MTKYSPQKGDRVRVVLEGEVSWAIDLLRLYRPEALA